MTMIHVGGSSNTNTTVYNTRTSRVMSIHVTSNSNNELWPMGFGHDFGWNQSYRYYQNNLQLPTTTKNNNNNTTTTIFQMIGHYHVAFLKQLSSNVNDIVNNNNNHYQIVVHKYGYHCVVNVAVHLPICHKSMDVVMYSTVLLY